MLPEEQLIERYKTILPNYTPNPYYSKEKREREIETKIKELLSIIKKNGRS